MISLGSRLALFLGTCSLCLSPVQAQEQQGAEQAPPPLRPSGPIVVTYDGGELTIQAFNASLASVLRAVANHIGVLVEIPPDANEAIIGAFGPGSPRNVLAALLNGSRFNYVMTGSSSDGRLQQLLLTVRTNANEKPPREVKQQVIASAARTVAVDSAATSEKPAPVNPSPDQLRAQVDALIAEASTHAAAEAAVLGENVKGYSAAIEQLQQVMESALKQANGNASTDSGVQEGKQSQSESAAPGEPANFPGRARQRRR